MTTYHQALRFGPVALDADNAEPAPYMLSGRKMYVLGTTDGAFRPIGAEHLVGEMGGVWAHPVRFADGWFCTLYDGQGSTRLDDCHDFEGHLSDVEFRWRHGNLAIKRVDFVAEDDAGMFGLVELRNDGEEPWSGRFGMEARLRIRPSWFSGWEMGSTHAHNEHGVIVAFDDLWQGQWGLAFGGPYDPDEVVFGVDGGRPTGELRYAIDLQPGEVRRLEFSLTCDHQNGHHGALQLRGTLAGRGEALLAAKRDLYARTAWGGVVLEAPDERIVHEYGLAKVNLHMLAADYSPYLPGYFLAGVPEYPQLFGCDNAYSVAGATAAGFQAMARSSLSIVGNFASRATGRVPHEVTTNGRTFHPGNTQETPQFTLAVWDYFRWTGDLAFLRSMYPVCREGVMEYVPTLWDFDGDGYPMGDAMVERTGMGSLKLDSACYLYAAWQALAHMAKVLNRPEAHDYQQRAGDWRERFERDWWLPEEQLYADSLHSDLRPQLDGHWTQVVPVQLGIARQERALIVLDEIERSFVNKYGLVHTRGRDERVWTLPTGLLALAELRYGRLEQAITHLHNIALTTEHGMLGSFEELIPEGLCFVQLWSAAIFVQGIVEGLFGLEPRAHEHTLRLNPRLPADWPAATLRNVRIGEHALTLEVSPNATIITHTAGDTPITIEHIIAGTRGASGTVVDGRNLQAMDSDAALVFSSAIPPGHTARITYTADGSTIVEFVDTHRDENGEAAGPLH